MSEQTISSLKKALRREALSRRRALSSDEIEDKGHAIAERLFATQEWMQSELILFYVDAKDNEVPTRGAIERAIREGRRVACPITKLETRSLVFSEISGPGDLVKGCFGLLEPNENHARPVETCDASLIIVPGLAFDESCNRLGYGGGFYDRALANSNAPSIALAYDCQIVDEIPVGEYDKVVDKIMTETRII
ncbi:5-formyltetrahydrofolate cyclo-ligase [Candidatus Hydrogenedentota bacterium]